MDGNSSTFGGPAPRAATVIGLAGLVMPGHGGHPPPAPGPAPAPATASRPAASPATGPAKAPPLRHDGVNRIDGGTTAQRPLSVEFTGRGGEYFRIWIVNLLLTAVTFGLYLPWARVRKLRYFYGNTLVDGHALDFHGRPRRMLRGLVLVGGLYAAMQLASQVSVVAALLAVAVVAGLAPWLFQSAWAFRIGHTSWRGLRFEFTGSPRGAYAAFSPALLLGVAFAVALAAAEALGGEGEGGSPTRTALGLGLGLILLAMVLALPYLHWRLKAFVHGHFRYASVTTKLNVGPGRFYVIAAVAFGMLLAIGALAGFCLGMLRAAAGPQPAGNPLLLFGLGVAVPALVLLCSWLFVTPYVNARLQNLLWSGTEARGLQIESQLRARSLIALTLRNALLTALTFGLYWPFAAIATARLRLSALRVDTRLDLDRLSEQQRARSRDASGEMAAEIAGVDIGL